MAAVRNRAEIERALDRPTPATRCFLLYGADESGSRALAARLAKALGDEAERIDLTPAQLKSDPALLADEAASSSLFGDARYIRVEGAGEDCLTAVEGLLDAQAAGNPVVLVGAGSLKKDGKLVKRITADAAGLAFASYAPDADDLERIATDLARGEGLRLDPGVARRLGDACGGDRAILASEVEKLALYADATAARMVEVDHAMLDAIGADAGDGDTALLLDAVFGGDMAALDRELARATAEGQDGVPLVRAMLRRALPMAMARAEIDRGTGAEAALDKVARFVFFRERKAMLRDLPRWSGPRLNALVERLGAAEREIKSSGGAGPLALDTLLFAVARAARR